MKKLPLVTYSKHQQTHQESNLDLQNQNLSCCQYTIGQ
jgi:hypothetical protein